MILLVVLHLIKPGLDPSWRMVSEYEIGRHDWVMRLAFLFLASGCVALFAAVRSQIRTTDGRVGLAFLLLSATGMTIAAVFVAAPIIAGPGELTSHGNLHALGAFLDIPSFPVAALLVSRGLLRNPDWSLAGNPKIPSVEEAMNEALTPEEAERFAAHLRPLVEAGRGTQRRAVAVLRAVKG